MTSGVCASEQITNAFDSLQLIYLLFASETNKYTKSLYRIWVDYSVSEAFGKRDSRKNLFQLEKNDAIDKSLDIL